MRDNGVRATPTVVLVDDSQELRSLLRTRLEAAGFQVVGEGADGDEAIVLAHRLEPALMLLDTSMPRVDGIEALPLVLAMSPTTSVVMFTGFEERGLAATARELGAADFIEKSIRLDDLPARLDRVLAAGPQDTGEDRPVTTAGPEEDRNMDRPGPEQALLSEHVQQFRELFDRAEIGMATLTTSGTIVRANKALAGLMSCRPDDLVGVDYARLTAGRGDDLDQRLEDIQGFGAEVATFEHDLPAPPGMAPSSVVRVTLAPIRDANRRVLYVFAQVQDVTAQRAMEGELRRTEETFRRLVTAVSEYAIFMLDVEGRVISWNQGAQRIKGYAAHEIVGRHFSVFYPPEEQATGHPRHNLERALAEGTYAEEGWRIRKDGTRFWASVAITPVYDEDGRHVGFAKVTRDQTQQRDHEEERRQLLEQRIHLLAVTAHELRTPTTVIDGSADALQATWHELSEDERDRLLANIRNSADRLRRLASDLATASQLDAEMLPLRIEQVSLAEVFRNARTRSRLATGNVPIELDVPDDATVLADPHRLAQALDNLLDNAARHGAPPIRMTAAVADHVTIRVTDAGPGVPETLLPRLFDRFAVAGPSGGTGLGLHLVREIAREHGGEATYDPPSPSGPAAFRITLPAPGTPG